MRAHDARHAREVIARQKQLLALIPEAKAWLTRELRQECVRARKIWRATGYAKARDRRKLAESDAIKTVRAVSSTKPTTVEGSIGVVSFVAWRTGFTCTAPRSIRQQDVDACEGRLPISIRSRKSPRRSTGRWTYYGVPNGRELLRSIWQSNRARRYSGGFFLAGWGLQGSNAIVEQPRDKRHANRYSEVVQRN
jgi:hypothetical protein